MASYLFPETGRRCALALAIVMALGGSLAQAAPPENRPPPDRSRAARPKLDKSSPQYKEAVKLFKAGIKDFDGGYYNRAIKKFKAALKLYPSPKIHTRIALCYKWLGNYLKALEHYELFLKELPETPDNPADAQLRKRVQENEIPRLKAMVAQVTIQLDKPADAEIRINGRPVARSPVDRSFRLNPGPIAVTATKKGYYTYKRDLTLERGKSATVRIKLVKIKPKVVKKVVTIRETPIYKRWWFWTVIGTVVAGGAAGLGAWLSLREVPRDITGTPVRHDGLTVRW